MADDLEKPASETPAAVAQRWIAELGLSEKFHAEWVRRAKSISRRYASDRASSDTKRRYSMLWSNTQTITPALYARPPQPVVGRRFKDEDPVGRLASEVLERALSYSIDNQDLDGVLRLCAQDFALIARAQVWERYCPTYGDPVAEPQEEPLQVASGPDGAAYAEEGPERPDEAPAAAPGADYAPIVYEESRTDFVNWEDFGFGPARSWDEVPYVWRRVFMDRKALRKRFGDEIGRRVPLDWGGKDESDETRELTGKAAVYEIWDKCSRKAFWINRSFAESPLDDRDDPLGLDGFFPCPRPLFGTLAPGKLNPVPDFLYYQDQSQEIDALTSRIAELQTALKVRGFYAGDLEQDLNSLLNANNNTLIPVSSWRSLAEDGGVRGKIEWMPLELIVSALKACIELRKQLIADVYQITGVSDIQRGASDPRETYGAQQIKANFGSLRIRDRQNEIVRFARDVLRIKGEVIAEHFGIPTLQAITGMKIPTNADKQQAQALAQRAALQAQVAAEAAQQQGQPAPPPPPLPPEVQAVLSSPTWEDVVGLLRNNAMRQFRIDVESDSTVEPNQAEEKSQAVEFATALGGFLTQAGTMVQQAPEAAPMFAELTKMLVRKFRAGREVEDSIERTMNLFAQKAGQAQPGAEAAPPPDRTPVEVAQINLQREQVKQQGEDGRAQLEAQVAQGDQQLKAREQHLKVVAANRDPMPQVTI